MAKFEKHNVDRRKRLVCMPPRCRAPFFAPHPFQAPRKIAAIIRSFGLNICAPEAGPQASLKADGTSDGTSAPLDCDGPSNSYAP